MEPDSHCPGCGLTFAEAEAGACTDAPAEAAASGALRYQPPAGPASGIKVRRDSPPVRADRAADHEAHARGPRPDAAGATPPRSGTPGVAVARPPARRPLRPTVAPIAQPTTWATPALVTGLFPFIPLLPPVAVVFGALAVRDVRRGAGLVTGLGRAVFGILAGTVGTLGWILLAVWLATADFSSMEGFVGRMLFAMNMGALEMIPEAQEQYRSARFTDDDRDGKGEYGAAAALTAHIEELDLSALESGKLGWELRIELPGTVNGRESRWAAFMVPTDPEAGRPWLYIDESRILRQGQGVTRQPSRRLAKTWPATNSRLLLEEMFPEG